MPNNCGHIKIKNRTKKIDVQFVWEQLTPPKLVYVTYIHHRVLVLVLHSYLFVIFTLKEQKGKMFLRKLFCCALPLDHNKVSHEPRLHPTPVCEGIYTKCNYNDHYCNDHISFF